MRFLIAGARGSPVMSGRLVTGALRAVLVPRMAPLEAQKEHGRSIGEASEKRTHIRLVRSTAFGCREAAWALWGWEGAGWELSEHNEQ